MDNPEIGQEEIFLVNLLQCLYKSEIVFAFSVTRKIAVASCYLWMCLPSLKPS